MREPSTSLLHLPFTPLLHLPAPPLSRPSPSPQPTISYFLPPLNERLSLSPHSLPSLIPLSSLSPIPFKTLSPHPPISSYSPLSPLFQIVVMIIVVAQFRGTEADQISFAMASLGKKHEQFKQFSYTTAVC